LIQLKVNYNGELRRVSCANTFAAVQAAISAFVERSPPQQQQQTLLLSYVDEENDRVTLASDAELHEAIRVASKNGVLRLNAEQRLSSAAPAAAAAVPAGTAAAFTLEDKEFWEQLPAWLQQKIVSRTAEQQTASGAASLPLGDAAHFACLPADVRASIRARAAAHSEQRRAKLAKKAQHHSEAASALHAKAQRLLAKAHEQEQIAAYKQAKLHNVDGGVDDDNVAKEAAAAAQEPAAAAVWARVPLPVKTRIVARWLSAATPADVNDVAVFEALPAVVQQRVRARAASRHGGGRCREGREGRGDGERERDEAQEGGRDAHWWRHGGRGGRHCGRRGEGREGDGERGSGARGGWWRGRAANATAAADESSSSSASSAPATAPTSAYAGAAFENAPRADSMPKPQL